MECGGGKLNACRYDPKIQLRRMSIREVEPEKMSTQYTPSRRPMGRISLARFIRPLRE